MSSLARRAALAPALAAILVVAGLAASSGPSGCAKLTPCKLNSDCIDSFCVDGVCKQECFDAEQDCPRGYTCDINARCQPPLPSGSGGAGGGSTSTSTSTSSHGGGGSGGGPSSTGP